jgi:competence protein CoiA
LVVESARRQGWIAIPEVQGNSPLGDWRADVLATKGTRKVAVEAQWSAQTVATTLERQDRYRAGGVEGVWLLRQAGFPISRELPAIVVGGELPNLTALLPLDEETSSRARSLPHKWLQVMPIEEFLDALFGGRFWFGPAIGTAADVDLVGGKHHCYSCGAEGTVISNVQFQTKYDRCWFTLKEIGEIEAVGPEVLALQAIASTSVRFRYRRNRRGRLCLFNECIHCGAIIGQAYIQHVIGRVGSKRLIATPAWRKAAMAARNYLPRWRVNQES